jgi:hypothetical protein
MPPRTAKPVPVARMAVKPAQRSRWGLIVEEAMGRELGYGRSNQWIRREVADYFVFNDWI